MFYLVFIYKYIVAKNKLFYLFLFYLVYDKTICNYESGKNRLNNE